MMGHVREFLSMFQLFNFWNWRLKSKTVGAHGQAWQKVLDREVNGGGEKSFVSGRPIGNHGKNGEEWSVMNGYNKG